MTIILAPCELNVSCVDVVLKKKKKLSRTIDLKTPVKKLTKRYGTVSNNSTLNNLTWPLSACLINSSFL